MSKADAMIEDLGYKKQEYPEDAGVILYIGSDFKDSIGFLLKIQEYSVPENVVNVEMHKALKVACPIYSYP